MTSTTITSTKRADRVRAWLQGSAGQCVLLLPDRLQPAAGFARTLGLADAQRCVLWGGVMRPWFQPHPRFVSCLRQGGIEDIALVTTTDLPGLGRSVSMQRAVDFLQRQLARLAEYRTNFAGTRLSPGIALHGWLWDCELGWLMPYDHERRDLAVEERIPLLREAPDAEVEVGAETDVQTTRGDHPAFAPPWVAEPVPAAGAAQTLRTGT